MAFMEIAHSGNKYGALEGAQVLAQFCDGVGYFHGDLQGDALAFGWTEKAKLPGVQGVFRKGAVFDR
jgi:hypothetical protein